MQATNIMRSMWAEKTEAVEVSFSPPLPFSFRSLFTSCKENPLIQLSYPELPGRKGRCTDSYINGKTHRRLSYISSHKASAIPKLHTP